MEGAASVAAVRRELGWLVMVGMSAGHVCGLVLLIATAWLYAMMHENGERTAALNALVEIDMMHDAIRADALSYKNGLDPQQAREDLAGNRAAILRRFQSIEHQALPAQTRAALPAQEAAVTRYALQAEQLTSKPSAAISSDEIEHLNSAWDKLVPALAGLSEGLHHSIKATDRTVRRGFTLAAGALAATVLVAVALFVWISRRTTGKILQVNVDLAAAQEAAEQASASKTEFLAAMSHEIRTPLTGMIGLADVLAAEDLAEKHRQYVQAIRMSGEHLLNVINDILDFSRIETGRLDLETLNFSPAALLEGVQSLAHPLAVERGLELRFEHAQPLPAALKGDPVRVRQVLLNLLTNAVKFTERGSVVVATSQRPLDDGRLGLRFEVRDTGVGIPQAQQAQLFNAFTQADRSIARKYGGSGLGLAISKRLVTAMGGEIGFDSLERIGSRFWFEAPFELGDATALGPRRREIAPSPPRHILVAEDVKINRDVLRDMLCRMGHSLVFAENGVQAVERVQREPFDLVLMDIQMPVMDGVQATRRIRALGPPFSDIPILALTANVMAREQEAYLAAGMNDCLMKPIDWAHLSAAIARFGPERRAAATPPAPVGAPDLAPPPLVDWIQVRAMGAEGAGAWLRRGLDSAKESAAVLAGLPVGSPEMAPEAHRLRGTVGTLGLARISAIAGQIEDAACEGRAIEGLLAELRSAIEASQRAIEAEASA